MKRSNFFIGAFFISAGILWLNYYFEFYSFSTKELYKYWPIYLIIFGLNLLNLPKFLRYFFSFFAGVLTSLLIYSAIIYLTGLSEIEKDQLEEKIEKKIDKYLEDNSEKF